MFIINMNIYKIFITQESNIKYSNENLFSYVDQF